MDTTTPVTAIITTFNRADFLRDAIRSVFDQTPPPAQVIVVDDGSTDQTAGVVAAAGTRIQFLRQSHTGKSAALNAALRVATHPFIWIMDDDDLAVPGALSHLVRALQNAPGAGFAYGRHERFWDGAKPGAEFMGPGYWQECPPDEFGIAVLEDMFVHQGSMLVRREVYDEVGPFDEGLQRSIDYEMQLRFARIAQPVAIDNTIFWQRLHDGPRGAEAATGISQREAQWVMNDRIILLRVREQWPLSSYLPRAQAVDDPSRDRRALLQRATVMARHKLWDFAVADFSAAAKASAEPLSEVDRKTVRRATGSKFRCTELVVDAGLATRLGRLARSNDVGMEIAMALARSLVWRIREGLLAGRWKEASLTLRTMTLITVAAIRARVSTVTPVGLTRLRRL